MKRKPRIDSVVKTHHFENDASGINLTSSAEGDDDRDYNKLSDAIQYMDCSGEKHVYRDLLQTCFELRAGVGRNYYNRFMGCFLKQSRNIEKFLQLFTSVPKMWAFVRTGTFESFFRNGFMIKQLTTAPDANNVLYVKNAVAALQNEV